jgi:exosortase sorting signal-containing protein
MRSLLKPLFSLLLFTIFSFVLAFTCLNDNASAQECEIIICKTAEGAGDLLFPFTVDEGGMISEFNLIDGGLCQLEFFTGSTDLDIVEGPVPGWVLGDVHCEESGLTITSIENGINVVCDGPNSGVGSCNFINVPGVAPTNIPTLSEWGMIAAAVGLAMIGVFFAVRRRAAV